MRTAYFALTGALAALLALTCTVRAQAIEKAIVRTADRKGGFFSVWVAGGFREFRLTPETRFRGARSRLRPGAVVTVSADASGAATSVEVLAATPAKGPRRPEAIFTGLVAETNPAAGTFSITDDWRDTRYDFQLSKGARIVSAAAPKALLGLAGLKKGMKVDVHARDDRARMIEILTE